MGQDFFGHIVDLLKIGEKYIDKYKVGFSPSFIPRQSFPHPYFLIREEGIKLKMYTEDNIVLYLCVYP